MEQVVEQAEEASPDSSVTDQGTADGSFPSGSSSTVVEVSSAAGPSDQQNNNAPGLPPLPSLPGQGKHENQSEGSPTGSGNSSTAKRVGFVQVDAQAQSLQGPQSGSSMSAESTAFAVSPFQSIALEPFLPGDTDASASTSTGSNMP